jgi:hypothetical protein
LPVSVPPQIKKNAVISTISSVLLILDIPEIRKGLNSKEFTPK